MITKNEFIVKEEQAFRLKIRNWKAIRPNDLHSIEFVQECLKDGEVDFSSTYHFMMSNDELKNLIKGLEGIANE